MSKKLMTKKEFIILAVRKICEILLIAIITGIIAGVVVSASIKPYLKNIQEQRQHNPFQMKQSGEKVKI